MTEQTGREFMDCLLGHDGVDCEFMGGLFGLDRTGRVFTCDHCGQNRTGRKLTGRCRFMVQIHGLEQADLCTGLRSTVCTHSRWKLPSRTAQ